MKNESSAGELVRIEDMKSPPKNVYKQPGVFKMDSNADKN
jgi:hypothetical protein